MNFQSKTWIFGNLFGYLDFFGLGYWIFDFSNIPVRGRSLATSRCLAGGHPFEVKAAHPSSLCCEYVLSGSILGKKLKCLRSQANRLMLATTSFDTFCYHRGKSYCIRDFFVYNSCSQFSDFKLIWRPSRP